MRRLGRKGKLLSASCVLLLALVLCLTLLPGGRDLTIKASNYLSIQVGRIVEVGEVYANPDAIDVGAAAINRDYRSGPGDTVVVTDNPANDTGSITSVEIWMQTEEETNVDVATFSASGNDLTTRDSEALGPVASGSKQTFAGLSMDVVTGDYLGCYTGADGRIELQEDGGTGAWKLDGDYIPCTSETFSVISDGPASLYGIGETAACEPDISNIPATWAVGVVSTSTDYWSAGSAPTWPLDDGECHFTVTNNSGGAVSITVKATNFTGGVGWTLTSDSPGEDTVRMRAGKSGDANEAAMVVLTTSEQSFISGLADSGTKKWELKMETPTSYTDGAEKTSIVTLTATCD